MSETGAEPLRVAVWVAMADHFLDTETRHDLPLTALNCVEAGLSAAQAREVWQHEVSPAVGFNRLLVAGEWAYWDRDWLIARIASARSSAWHRSGGWRWLRARVWPTAGDCLAIERGIEFLQAVPSAADRRRTANDLARLARHAFDFCGQDFSRLEVDERERLVQLYRGPFSALIEPALLRCEHAAARNRLQCALFGREGSSAT